jgi:hypothetical protein
MTERPAQTGFVSGFRLDLRTTSCPAFACGYAVHNLAGRSLFVCVHVRRRCAFALKAARKGEWDAATAAGIAAKDGVSDSGRSSLLWSRYPLPHSGIFEALYDVPFCTGRLCQGPRTIAGVSALREFNWRMADAGRLGGVLARCSSGAKPGVLEARKKNLRLGQGYTDRRSCARKPVSCSKRGLRQMRVPHVEANFDLLAS